MNTSSSSFGKPVLLWLFSATFFSAGASAGQPGGRVEIAVPRPPTAAEAARNRAAELERQRIDAAIEAETRRLGAHRAAEARRLVEMREAAARARGGRAGQGAATGGGTPRLIVTPLPPAPPVARPPQPATHASPPPPSRPSSSPPRPRQRPCGGRGGPACRGRPI